MCRPWVSLQIVGGRCWFSRRIHICYTDRDKTFIAEKGGGPPGIGMLVDRTMCMHCGACVGTCRFNAIFLHETRVEFYDSCTKCGVCIRVCPVGAVDWKPEDSGRRIEMGEEKA